MTIIPFPEKQAGCCSSRLSKPDVLMLPVAPRSMARIRFAPSENLAQAIRPIGALAWLRENCDQGVEVKGVKIEGPGDPLADIGPTMETLHLLQQKHPELSVGLITMGIHGEKYARELKNSGVNSVTILVDVADAETAVKLYAWIRPGKKTVPLTAAADLLLSEQLKAARAFINAGCIVTIRTTVYPGYNDDQIVKIAETFSACGAKEIRLVPFHPVQDGQDIMPDQPDETFMNSLAEAAGQHLEVSVDQGEDAFGPGMDCASVSGQCATNALLPRRSKKRPNVAVASLEGIEVDLHIGEAYQFLIYGPRDDGLACLLEARPAPEPGGGDTRWQTLAESLDDCFALLASGGGAKPKKVLGDQGITVVITEDDIEEAVDALFGGGKKKKG